MVNLLQPLVFPDNAPVAGAEKLYFKGAGRSEDDGSLTLPAGETLDFSTYFNLFSAAKWRKWTGMKNPALVLRGSGRLKLEIVGRNIKTGRSGVLLEAEYLLEDEKPLQLPENDWYEVLTLSLAAVDDCSITGGGWYGETVQERVVKAAVVICTFNREQYLWPNVDVLTDNLSEGWKVFIINQGEDFAEEKIAALPDSVTIFKNPNLGGSGGFTRGIVEALHADYDFTHALLMDDDVRIEPAALDKTNRLLKYLKPEYCEYFTAGAMLRMDEPVVQHECGARWTGLRVKHSFQHLELDKVEDLLENESLTVFNKNQYGAWWYCAVPLGQGMLSDLPLPVFVNGDDIEYSMRRAPGLLRLNGIGVWHEAFELKASTIKRYLTVRNGLIINVRYGVPFIKSLIFVIGRWVQMLFHYKPEDRRFVILAVEHFLEGPQRLSSLCGPQLFEIGSEPTKNAGIIGLIVKFSRYYSKALTDYKKVKPDSELWKGLFNV